MFFFNQIVVLKGRNLLEKGKGGNDAYCMIGMGKEKFLTSVKSKTALPQWDEQAELYLYESFLSFKLNFIIFIVAI